MRARETFTALLLTCALAAVPASALRSPVQATPVKLSLRSLQGDSVQVGGGAPPVLLAVFATWCRSCKDEVAAFNRLQKEFAPRGVRVVALSADDIPDERLRAWLARYHGEYPVVRDTTRAALQALRVVGVPEAHLVGSDGRVMWSKRGPVESGLPSLRDAVARLRSNPASR
ncbi:MAG: TlpA disulfide reductase family protein [Gemmatimonas sp.]